MKNILFILLIFGLCFGKFAPEPVSQINLELNESIIASIISNDIFIVALVSPFIENQPMILNVIESETMKLLDSMNIYGGIDGFIRFYDVNKYFLLNYASSNNSLIAVDIDDKGIQSISKSIDLSNSIYPSSSLTKQYLYYISVNYTVDPGHPFILSLWRIYLNGESFKPEYLLDLTGYFNMGQFLSFLISYSRGLFIVNLNEPPNLIIININNGKIKNLVELNWYYIGYDSNQYGYSLSNDEFYNESFYEQWDFDTMEESNFRYRIAFPLTSPAAFASNSTFLLGIDSTSFYMKPCTNINTSSYTSILTQISYSDQQVYYLCDYPSIFAIGADDWHVYFSPGNSTIYKWPYL